MPTSLAPAPVIQLPSPSRELGTSLLEALRRRRTDRAMRTDDLSRQQLSDLLWAACGVNRAVGPFGAPGRTAGSASNSQEIELYVSMAEGAYRFDPLQHRLHQVCDADLRVQAMTPGQRDSFQPAPVILVFVADLARLTHTAGFDEPGLHDPEVQRAYYYVDTGLIAQNVYLHAAACGLAAWFHNCNREALAHALRLNDAQRVLFAQSVGLPRD